MGFLDPTSDFRWLLPTETDANSPLSEELMSQIRENLETSIMSTIYTGLTGVITNIDNTIPAAPVLTITAGSEAWGNNQAAGLRCVFDGTQSIGEFRTVTSNDAIPASGSGDVTLASALSTNVAVGDSILIMYTITGKGHTHNGTDSAPVGVDVAVGSLGAVSVTDSDPVVPFGPTESSPGIKTYPIELTLNSAMKSVYFAGYMQLNNPFNKWSDRTGELNLQLYCDAVDTFTWIDNSGVAQTNPSVDINKSGTIKVNITDFSNAPDLHTYNSSDLDRLYFKSEKIDITSLSITHLDLRRYYFRYSGSLYVAGSFNITIIGGSIYGSSTLT